MNHVWVLGAELVYVSCCPLEQIYRALALESLFNSRNHGSRNSNGKHIVIIVILCISTDSKHVVIVRQGLVSGGPFWRFHVSLGESEVRSVPCCVSHHVQVHETSSDMAMTQGLGFVP